MSVVNDDLRKAIAEAETRLAKGRRKYWKSVETMQTQACLEATFYSLNDTLQQLEKSHHVVAASLELLEEMKQHERASGRSSRSSQGTSTLRLTRPTLSSCCHLSRALTKPANIIM